jgi:hypothetical protein
MRPRAGFHARRVQRAVAEVTLAAAFLVATPAAANRSSDDLEYRVKAEFVERFTHFIDWPPGAFATGDSHFDLCVVGETPVTNYLEQMARSRRIKDRPVDLRHVKAGSDLSFCHLVFIASDERERLRQILTAVAGRPILTIADAEGFGRAGVLINLVLDNQGRVGFEISSRVARRTALTLNAQLLRLSRQAPQDD